MPLRLRSVFGLDSRTTSAWRSRWMLAILCWCAIVILCTSATDTTETANNGATNATDILSTRSSGVVIEPTTTSPVATSTQDSPSIPPSSLPGRDAAVVEADRTKVAGESPSSDSGLHVNPVSAPSASEESTSGTNPNVDPKIDSAVPLQQDETFLTGEGRLNAYLASFIEAVKITAKTGLNIFFIFGAIVQYYGQFWEIRRGKGEAFSPLVCLVLLSANIIRIFYWFGVRFDDLYLYQSAVMVFVQIMMLEAICTAKEKRPSANGQKKRFTDFRLVDFWAWDDWWSYLLCIFSFSVMLLVACVLALPYPNFYSWLGGAGLMIEAALALPQLYRNYLHGSDGLDPFLIWTWAIGDVAKSALAVSLQAPLAFVLSGLFQVVTDILILLQIYSDRKKKDKAKVARGVELATYDNH